MPKAIHQNITRRTALAGAAAMIPAAAIPALALAGGEPDPIFAAIEAHKAARAHYIASLARAEAIENVLRARTDAIADAEAPECIPLRLAYQAAEYPGHAAPDDSPEWVQWKRVQDGYCDSRHNKIRLRAWYALEETPEFIEKERLQSEGADCEIDAVWDLYGTVPTTAAGAVALIRYILDLESEGAGPFDTQRTFLIDGEAVQYTAPQEILSSLGEFLEGMVVASARS